MQYTYTRNEAHYELLKKFLRRSEEHTSELQSHLRLVCRLLLEKKKREECPHGHECHHGVRHAASPFVVSDSSGAS